MQEYQCGVRSEDLIPFGSFPTEFDPLSSWYGVTEPCHDKYAGLVFLIIMLTIPLLCVFAFCWVVDRVSNFMAKLRHRRFYNEEVNQILEEQVPDHIRGYQGIQVSTLDRVRS